MVAAELLRVDALGVRYAGLDRPALADVSLRVAEGESVAIVGPSGSGKTTLVRAIIGLLPPGVTTTGTISWRDHALGEESLWRRLRGLEIGLMLQDPQSSLHPVLTIGEQVAAPLRAHHRLDRSAADARARKLLAEVRLRDVGALMRRYPHELSGGMRQRVALAAALAASPSLLLADEPTSALDTTTQRAILELLRRLQRARKLALVFVTHDLALVPLVADRVIVLADGRVVETGTAQKVLGQPAHPVTRAMVATVPIAVTDDETTAPVLTARDLSVTLSTPAGRRAVVRGVDLDLVPGQTLGLAGESGCGKTTLARALARHVRASGTLRLAGHDLLAAKGAGLRRLRRAVQLVSQDPAAALDPRQTVRDALNEAAKAAGRRGEAAWRSTGDRLAEVDLPAAVGHCYPHELSGGQQRRVLLARALAAEPYVIIADEPTSSLDPPTQQRILELLVDVQARRGVALLVISHDVDMLRQVCHRVAVMVDGMIVEVFAGGAVDRARHPYTRALLAASPRAVATDVAASPVPAAVSGSLVPGRGCPYAPRCPHRLPACLEAMPDLVPVASDHLLRCPIVAGTIN